MTDDYFSHKHRAIRPGVGLSNLPSGLAVRMSGPGGMKDEGQRLHGPHKEKSRALSRSSATISKSGS
jgi:hypothetical protein